MTTSLTSDKGEFLDRRLLEEEEEERMADLRAIDYDDDDDNYAHDIEQYEYEVAARSYIPEDYDYEDDDEDEYEDVMDYTYE